MEIFVQARKDGYNVLFPKPTPKEFYKFASDLQSASAKNDSKYYGKNFYSLAFAEGGFIFTKYVIGYDIQRNNIGNVGISVFIPVAQKLSGDDVKKLLDELISAYCQNYCDDNKITNKREDWQLFTSVLKRYEVLQGDDFNDSLITVGSKEPAFHYYKNDRELIDLFGNPFQEEYAGFKQVFFIDNQLKDTANPLDIIKNSGVEVNPDLKNEYYYLNNYNSSKEIKITANGMLRSDKRGENKIREKWLVEIKYSKNDVCFEPINASGTLSDKTSDIFNFLETKGNRIMLKYDAFSNPAKKVKPLKIEIKDKDGKLIDGADIQIGMRPFERVSGSAKTIDFVGEDIIKKWEISAKKESESLYSKPVFVNPKNQIGSVVLTLQKQKVIKIFAKDNENGNYIPNFKIWLNDGKGYRENVTDIVFTNDEIDKNWTIEISKKEGRYAYSGKIEFCPATIEYSLHVPCHKIIDLPSNNIRYKISAGEHGKKTTICPDYSNSINGNDLDENCIIANKGYVFKNWKLKNDKLVAQYEKKKSWYQNSKFIAGTVAGALVLVVGILAFYYFLNKETPLTAQQITTYVEGDSLMLEKLESYKAIWEKQKPEITTLGGIVWYNPTTWFVGSNESKTDSTDYKKWDEYKKSLDRAIEIRSLLNRLSFAELKNQEDVIAQQSFKAAIEKIDSAKYSEVGQKLGDVSGLTLTQVADSIKAILTPIEKGGNEDQQESNIVDTERDTTQRSVRQPNQGLSTTVNQTDSIIRELQSAKITRDELKKDIKVNSSKIAGSIQLYKEFWSLVGSNTRRKDDYDALLNKIQRDSILEKSELRKFLDSICASPADFEKFKNVRGKAQYQSLSELKELIK